MAQGNCVRLSEIPDKRPLPRSWQGGWTFDSKLLTLDLGGIDKFGNPVEYQVDLEECRNPAEVLDWIAQVAGKSWVTPEIVGGLVLALDEILGLQENLCGWGTSHTINPKQTIRHRLRTMFE